MLRHRVLVLLFLLLVGAFWSAGMWHADAVSHEAVITEAVCGQLLANTTEGRQALVSSVWWPPLPVLLRLPLTAFIAPGPVPVASLLISALAGAAVLLLLERLLRLWPLGRWRLLFVAALLLHPDFLRECISGSSATTVIFFLLVTVFGMVQWVTTHRVRYLVYMAVATALVALLSCEMIPWLVMVFLLVFMTLGVHPWPRGQKEAVLILVLLPPLYAAGLWMLMNWLIMGDALYFMRSLWGHPWFSTDPGQVPISGQFTTPAISAGYLVAILAGVLLLALSLWRRNRAGVFLGLLALSPLVQALLLSSRGMFWDSVPVLLVLVPLAIVAAAYLFELLPPGEKGRTPVLTAGFLALVVLLGMAWLDALAERAAPPSVTGRAPGRVQEPRATTREAGLGHVQTERAEVLPAVEARLRSRSPFAKVFVCGYDGLLLLGDHKGDLFLPTFDFNFHKAREDYHGQHLYLLIHRPAGRNRMESIHWKYERIYYIGSRWTLWDGDFGDWRLFEVVQAAL